MTKGQLRTGYEFNAAAADGHEKNLLAEAGIAPRDQRIRLHGRAAMNAAGIASIAYTLQSGTTQTWADTAWEHFGRYRTLRHQQALNTVDEIGLRTGILYKGLALSLARLLRVELLDEPSTRESHTYKPDTIHTKRFQEHQARLAQDTDAMALLYTQLTGSTPPALIRL